MPKQHDELPQWFILQNECTIDRTRYPGGHGQGRWLGQEQDIGQTQWIHQDSGEGGCQQPTEDVWSNANNEWCTQDSPLQESTGALPVDSVDRR